MNTNNFSIDYNGRAITFFLPNREDLIQKKIVESNTFYEIDLLEEIGRLPIGKGIFCDIGANIGNHTLYFASILDRHVYSFEPTNEANTILLKNIKLNGIANKVKHFCVALGAEEKQGYMEINNSNLGASRLTIKDGGNVSIKPLDSLIDDDIKVALLKIDVEGFEQEVLEGAKRIIEKHTPLIIAETQTHIDYLNISQHLAKYDYFPLGTKGATNTVFFISKIMWNEIQKTPLNTFLIRRDLDKSRRIIQGQSDRIMRKSIDIFSLLQKHQQSLTLVESTLCQLKSENKLDDLQLELAQQQERTRENLQDLIKSNELIIENLIHDNKDDLSENIKAIHSEIILNQELIKNNESTMLQIVDEDKIEFQKKLNNVHTSIEKQITTLNENNINSHQNVECKIIQNQQNTAEQLTSSIQSLEAKLSKSLKETNEQSKLLGQIEILLDDKYKNTESLDLEKSLQEINKYIALQNEINDKLYKKIKILYSSKVWRFFIKIRKFLRQKTQTFSEFKNKINDVYGDEIAAQLRYKLANRLIEKDIRATSNLHKKMHEIVSGNKNTVSAPKQIISRFSSLKGGTIANRVFVGIAAIPSRELALEQTINSLIDQVDSIGVYLNGWDEVPAYLVHKKISIIRSQEEGDIGDAGKFYWVDNHKGYYFTCDDDIIYPKNYIAGVIQKIKQYKYKAVIGWHGSVIIEPFDNYYSATSRRVFAFGSNRPDDTYVHILGTGTVGFHTSTLQVSAKNFKKPNMADVFFAELGQIQKVSFIVMKHNAKEMHSIESVQEDSINKHGIKNIASIKNTKVFQNQLVKTINWRLFNSNKLKIIIIGRFNTYTKGGINKSNHLIKNSLENLGHEVLAFDSETSEFNVPKNADIAFVYPGDPKRPDFKDAEEKMQLIRAKGIPSCINISYNNDRDRSEEIVRKIKRYNSDKALAPAFLMAFSDVVLSDIKLSDIRDFIIPFPKTIEGTKGKIITPPKFAEREGIVLGDATKLTNEAITGGDITPWISACKKVLPHVKLYVFKQYSGKFNIPGVETVPYMKDDFLEWTANRKLFVCLNTITTFEMTPTESQFVGTPVIYRPMPQSLSEYIGRSGISVTTPDDFAKMCAWLYNDEYAWNSYSKLSLSNSQTNNLDNLSIGLETAVRKVLFKANN